MSLTKAADLETNFSHGRQFRPQVDAHGRCFNIWEAPLGFQTSLTYELPSANQTHGSIKLVDLWIQ